MIEPLSMRLDHAMTLPFRPTWAMLNTFAGAMVRESDMPNPYQRLRWRRLVEAPRQPKPKQLAGVMLGPDCQRQWQQALAPFAQLDRSGFTFHDRLGVSTRIFADSVQHPTMFGVWAAASRGQFILTWQFAVRRKP